MKCSLRSICKDPAKALPWDSVLRDTNKALKEAYVFANLRVTILLEAAQPIPVLDKRFSRNVFGLSVLAGMKVR